VTVLTVKDFSSQLNLALSSRKIVEIIGVGLNMALKDVPQTFNKDTEEDVRIAVVKYFHELEFGLDEIRTETSFTIQLGHNTLLVEGQVVSQRNRVTGHSDILLT
jgi:hypothetical protein